MKYETRSRSRSPVRRSGGGGDGDRRYRGGGEKGLTRERSSSSSYNDKMIYLSNLPYEMTWMELKDIVREKAGEVNFVETLDGRDGRSKGCAVVEFKERASAIKCVESMHRMELHGRMIVVKEIRDPVAFFRKVKEDTGVDFLGCRDRTSRGGDRYAEGGLRRSGRSSSTDGETYGLSPAFLSQLNIKTPLVDRIFITNISYSCGVGRLFEICLLAGKVVWFDLQLDKDGKSKGMAICQYSHPIEAVQAISMLDGQRLFDRTITVKMDRFDKQEDRRDSNGLPSGLRGVGMGLGANGAPLADVAAVLSSASNQQQQQQQVIQVAQAVPQPLFSATGGGGVMTPGGALLATPSAAVASQLFTYGGSAAGGMPVAVSATPLANPTGNPYATSAAAFQQSAQHQQNFSVATQQPLLGAFGSNDNSNAVGSMFGSGGGQTNPPASVPFNGPNPSALYGGGGGPQRGLPSTSISSGSALPSNGSGFFGSVNNNFNGPSKPPSGVPPPVGGGVNNASANSFDGQPSRIILIKNLPMDYTWQIVSDRVQQFGDLESVEMVSPGVAKVRFLQMSDAERAKLALQGTTVEGRIIGIEYL